MLRCELRCDSFYDVVSSIARLEQTKGLWAPRETGRKKKWSSSVSQRLKREHHHREGALDGRRSLRLFASQSSIDSGRQGRLPPGRDATLYGVGVRKNRTSIVPYVRKKVERTAAAAADAGDDDRRPKGGHPREVRGYGSERRRQRRRRGSPIGGGPGGDGAGGTAPDRSFYDSRPTPVRYRTLEPGSYVLFYVKLERTGAGAWDSRKIGLRCPVWESIR